MFLRKLCRVKIQTYTFMRLFIFFFNQKYGLKCFPLYKETTHSKFNLLSIWICSQQVHIPLRLVILNFDKLNRSYLHELKSDIFNRPGVYFKLFQSIFEFIFEYFENFSYSLTLIYIY